MKLLCEQNLFSRRFEISNQYELISPLMWTYSKNYFLYEISQYPVNDRLLCKILSEAAPCAVDPNHSHYEKFRIILRMIAMMMESHFLVMLQVKDCNVTKKDLRHGHFAIISNYICNCNRFYHEQFIITPSFVVLKTLNI